MAIPSITEIPKVVGKMMTQVGSIEKKLEKFAKTNGKAAVDTAIKPVKSAVGQVISQVAALKKWVTSKLADVWTAVKELSKKVAELATRVGEIEKRLNPLGPLANQAALIATHEPRLRKIEGMDRITDTKLERAAGKTAKLEAEVRELKDAIKKLKKEVEANAKA
jgi:DNA anti-recombination protein RmuC